MTKEEALVELQYLFHKTRLTKNISVPPEIIAAILYSDVQKAEDKSWYRGSL